MLKAISEKNKMAFAHIGALVKGFVHNMNSPMSAVYGRAEMLKIRLNKLINENTHPELSELIEKCLTDAEMIHSNCTSVNDLSSNLMRKSISCTSTEKDLLDLTGLFNDEIMFLNCHMDFKHNFNKNIIIEDNIYLNNALYVDFSNTLNEIIEHSINVLKDTENKQITVKLVKETGYIIMEFRDNGPNPDESESKSLQTGENRDNVEYDSLFKRISALMTPYHAAIETNRTPHENIIKIKIPKK